MSHSLSFAQKQHSVYCRSKKRSYSKAKKSRKRNITFLLIFSIVLFSIIYITQANSLATGGYKLQEYKHKLTELQTNHTNLKLKLSEIRSLQYLEQRVESLDMKALSGVEIRYLSPTTQVAAR